MGNEGNYYGIKEKTHGKFYTDKSRIDELVEYVSKIGKIEEATIKLNSGGFIVIKPSGLEMELTCSDDCDKETIKKLKEKFEKNDRTKNNS